MRQLTTFMIQSTRYWCDMVAIRLSGYLRTLSLSVTNENPDTAQDMLQNWSLLGRTTLRETGIKSLKGGGKSHLPLSDLLLFTIVC